MNKTVLVAYASRHGATREIAEDVARVLFERGAEVAVCAADEVTDLAPYGAVVFGSAVYEGDWPLAATDFVRRFADDLEKLPVWLFSSGTAGAAPTETMRGWTHPPLLRSLLARINPRDHAVFGGRFDPRHLSLGDWWRYGSLRGVRGDFRDWGGIEAWANRVANALPACALTLPPEPAGSPYRPAPNPPHDKETR